MAGRIENTLDEIDSHLRNLRGQLAALEEARRQVVGDDDPTISDEAVTASPRAT